MTKKRSQGFGMVETMVAIAILGAITTVVISQQRLSNRAITLEASDTEINNLTKRIIAEISDQATCTLNFKTKDQTNTAQANLVTPLGPLVQEGDVIGSTLDASGFVTSTGEIKVEAIDTMETTPASVNEMVLRITFRKKDSGAFSTTKVTRDIPLITVLDASAKIALCFGDYDSIAKNAIELSCRGNSSTYQLPSVAEPYGSCVHTNNTTNVCPTGQYVKSVSVNASNQTQYQCASLNSMCTTAGQFVTEFKSDGTVTCGYALKACAPGEVIVKNSTGQHVCAAIDCTTASPVSAFGGFTAGGAPICTPLTGLKSCGVDNFATEVTTGGSITCSPMAVSAGGCGEGYRISGINPSGTIVCDRFINIPFNCGTNNAIVGIMANGDPDCKPIKRPVVCNGYNPFPVNTYQDCIAAGGTMTGHFTNNSMCIFSSGACPGGWRRCESYGTQVTASCTDTSNTYYCNASAITRYAVPLAGDGWQNTAQNTTTCYAWNGYPNTSSACFPSAYAPTYTAQTQVGCY